MKEIKFLVQYTTGFAIVRISEFLKRERSALRKNPHSIDFFAIIVITHGNGVHEIDFNTISYQKGDILFVNKGSVHAWLKTEDIEGYVIFFNEEFLFQNQVKFNDLSYTYPYNSVLYEAKLTIELEFGFFKNMASMLYKEFNNASNDVGAEIIKNLLRVFILKAQQCSKQEHTSLKGKSEDVVLFTRFQKLLNKRICSSRNAVFYCERLNVSYQKLNEVSKRLTNLTVKGVIDDYTVLEAKRQLSQKIKNVSEVSTSLGFEEATNFSKFFKKRVGILPKAFTNL